MNITFSNLISQLGIMFIIILTGYFTKRVGFFNENSDEAFAKLVVNITAPALIIISLSSPPEYLDLKNVLIVGILTGCIMIFSFLVSKLVIKNVNNDNSQTIVCRLSTVFGNTGFLGFPLSYGLFGQIGLLYASVFSAVQDVFFWSIGVEVMSGEIDRKKRFKNLLNPNMIAIFIGAIILFFKLKIPVFLENTLTMIGNVTIPVALMMVGSGFLKSKIDIKSIKSILFPAMLKLLLIPCFAGVILLFINIDITVKYILLLQLSMPTAATMAVLARNYGQDYNIASRMVALTTSLSAFTLLIILTAAESLF